MSVPNWRSWRGFVHGTDIDAVRRIQALIRDANAGEANLAPLFIETMEIAWPPEGSRVIALNPEIFSRRLSGFHRIDDMTRIRIRPESER
jgi:hypothetical protein